MMKFIFCFLLFVILHPVVVIGQQRMKVTTDSIEIRATYSDDTLKIYLRPLDHRIQMSFLMQGLILKVADMGATFMVSTRLPSAQDVKNEVMRHPDEVKAERKDEGEEVRPDLFPLIAALNKKPVHVYVGDSVSFSCDYQIIINRHQGELVFGVYLPVNVFPRSLSQDYIMVDLSSSHRDNWKQPEFEGRRLSREVQMPIGIESASKSRFSREIKVQLQRLIQVESSE